MRLYAIFVGLMLIGVRVACSQDLGALSKLSQEHNFRFSSTNADWKGSNVDFEPILPGKSVTLADVEGPGTISRIWMTILPSEPDYSRLMVIRIYWDGERNPSVECPIGDFFGVGHGLDENVNSIPVRDSADGKARCCFWKMPFRKSARITITNEGAIATWCFYYQVDGVYGEVQPDSAYFCAEYRQAFPCSPGDYVVADIHGQGQYVGTVLSVRSTADGWFGEGNDYFYVDGDKDPTLRGTGLEDYFGEAWGLRKTDGPYSGCSFFDGGRASCYRWHVPDPIRFRKSLKVTFQHQGVGVNAKGEDHNNIERPDEFSSVAFWYQIGHHAPYPPMPVGYDRLPFDYRHFVEAESVKIEPPSSGKTEVVQVNGLRGDHDLEWTGSQPGSQLNLPFIVNHRNRCQIMVLIATQSDGGLGKFLIDGKPASDTVSFYSPDYAMHHEVMLDFRTLEAGRHMLTLTSLGKPAGADDGTRFAIDGFIVQPLRKSQ